MYRAGNFQNLLGLEGFSDRLLKTHFSLYDGYVKNANKISEAAEWLVIEDKTETPAFSEMVRRLPWEFDGMRLHEYYFGNMIKGGRTFADNSALVKKIFDDFGCVEKWLKDFRAKGMMRGIGWVVLYYDILADRLLNVWINEHDAGHLAGCKPILVMDVFEHAYMLDYGAKRADYIEVFFKAIDWEAAEKRFQN